MSAPSQTYEVIFSSITHIRVEIEAESEQSALHKAERLYTDGSCDDAGFEEYGGETFADATASLIDEPRVPIDANPETDTGTSEGGAP